MLTQTSIGTLVALLQIRLKTMEIVDREDKRERRSLQFCLEELQKMRQPRSGQGVHVDPLQGQGVAALTIAPQPAAGKGH